MLQLCDTISRPFTFAFVKIKPTKIGTVQHTAKRLIDFLDFRKSMERERESISQIADPHQFQFFLDCLKRARHRVESQADS